MGPRGGLGQRSRPPVYCPRGYDFDENAGSCVNNRTGEYLYGR